MTVYRPLPESFLERMKKLMGADYQAFVAELNNPPHQGLRINTLKICAADFVKISPFQLRPVPWCSSGFYYLPFVRPGKHPYHAAGLYYIQEPSAMAAAEVLRPRPGEKVLDLAAAPGGKSTHIASLMEGAGLLVANEIHPARAKALVENVERCGIRHAIVTNETPQRLKERFPGFFDRVLVDAPCSGEGMFRKLREACEDWSPEKAASCASIQDDILQSAAGMLRPGGWLVYSTCTFSPEENERIIAAFLEKHRDFRLHSIHDIAPEFAAHFAKGRQDWLDEKVQAPAADVPCQKSARRDMVVPDISLTARLWPHQLEGEGHYIALLQKEEDNTASKTGLHSSPAPAPAKKKGKNQQAFDGDARKWYEQFVESSLLTAPEEITGTGRFMMFGDHLYLAPEGLPDLQGLKLPRAGWHLGTVKKGRFEPSHALALGLNKPQAQLARYTCDLSSDSEEVFSYLKGDVLHLPGEKGWTLVTVDGFPLGWGKQSGSQLKNHYPKGLRWL